MGILADKELLGFFDLCSILVFFNEGDGVFAIFGEQFSPSSILFDELLLFYRFALGSCLGVLTEDCLLKL